MDNVTINMLFICKHWYLKPETLYFCSFWLFAVSILKYRKLENTFVKAKFTST